MPFTVIIANLKYNNPWYCQKDNNNKFGGLPYMRASNMILVENTVPAVPARATAKRQTTKQTAKFGCTYESAKRVQRIAFWKMASLSLSLFLFLVIEPWPIFRDMIDIASLLVESLLIWKAPFDSLVFVKTDLAAPVRANDTTRGIEVALSRRSQVDGL